MVLSTSLPRLVPTPHRARILATTLLAVAAMGVDAAYIRTSVHPLGTPGTIAGTQPARHAIDPSSGQGLQASRVARQRVVGGGVVTSVTESPRALERFRVTVASQAAHYTVALSAAYGVLHVDAPATS